MKQWKPMSFVVWFSSGLIFGRSSGWGWERCLLLRRSEKNWLGFGLRCGWHAVVAQAGRKYQWRGGRSGTTSSATQKSMEGHFRSKFDQCRWNLNKPTRPTIWFPFGTLSAGLQIERETSSDSGTNFVKIHAPNPIINLNAEVAGLKPTVKEYCVTYYAGEVRPADGLFPKYDHFHFLLESTTVPGIRSECFPGKFSENFDTPKLCVT